jgi:hypothetical protein
MSLKEKFLHEMAEYWINVLYLCLMFGAFAWYRRLVLAAYHITYTHYFIAVIKALILAKVILIGDALRLGRGLEHKPLIYSTLFKTFLFTLFVGVFTILEDTTRGLVKGKGLAEALTEFFGKGTDELLANSLVVFASFIPFFALRELDRVLGEGKIWALFFKRRAHQASETSGPGVV